MTLRDNSLTCEELEAHRILDMVRNGEAVSSYIVTWCLAVLGDFGTPELAV